MDVLPLMRPTASLPTLVSKFSSFLPPVSYGAIECIRRACTLFIRLDWKKTRNQLHTMSKMNAPNHFDTHQIPKEHKLNPQERYEKPDARFLSAGKSSELSQTSNQPKFVNLGVGFLKRDRCPIPNTESWTGLTRPPIHLCPTNVILEGRTGHRSSNSFLYSVNRCRTTAEG